MQATKDALPGHSAKALMRIIFKNVIFRSRAQCEKFSLFFAIDLSH